MNSGISTTKELKASVMDYDGKVEIKFTNPHRKLMLKKDEAKTLFTLLEHLYGNTK